MLLLQHCILMKSLCPASQYPTITILETSSGLSNGAIGGIVAGAFIGVAALIALFVFLWSRKRRRANSAGGTQPYLGSPKLGGMFVLPALL